ncbi:MAG: SH3 domain-containing protein [Chloroflexi bacterium]|nr:SH3 domain-containing protein [Chloroflexota bacterium]
MSNGIKFVFLLSVILIVMFSMTFAQDLPFNAEVIVDTARMRWGPGPAHTVQHYANLGHVLTVLEADTESNPPWTWYRARTPSGVESWIRGDLIRRSTGAAARVDLPTGTYPVVENNLCNTTLFRRCQDGTDHDLWTAGYWANDRYNHWETGGWDLNVVYHNNPCKSDRLCTTRQDWDAGRLEAQLAVGSLTPDLTQTPVVIEQIVEVGVREVVWETLVGDATKQLLGRNITDNPPPGELYSPPDAIREGGGTTGTIIGRFRFDRESVRVTCQYWHKVDIGDGDFVASKVFTVALDKLPDDATDDGGEDDKSQVKCNDGIVEDNIVARQWQITVTRFYTGQGRIRNVSWKLTATFGDMQDEFEVCDTVQSAPCKKVLSTAVRTYLGESRKNLKEPVEIPATIIVHGGSPPGTTCEARKRTEGEKDREITRYEHTCKNTTLGADTPPTELRSTLTLHFTHDKTRGFLQPTRCPDTNNDGEPDCP